MRGGKGSARCFGYCDSREIGFPTESFLERIPLGRGDAVKGTSSHKVMALPLADFWRVVDNSLRIQNIPSPEMNNGKTGNKKSGRD